MVQIQLFGRKFIWTNDILLPGAIWLSSRLLIWIVMLYLAPNLPAPPGGVSPQFGWEVFSSWDSEHYYNIATSGYEFTNDGGAHNVAFFPLFPLMVKGLMILGLRFEIAGMLLNNLSFCLACYCLYFWIKQYNGTKAAIWSVAVLTWIPASMFAGVIYTEGLYLFLSIAALQAFDRKQYVWTALWGAMATATRPTGLALIPTFIITAWKQRKPIGAYFAGFATAIGLLLYSLYCAIQFGEPLAFIIAQKGWRDSLGFDWEGWLKMLVQIVAGTSNWKHGFIQDPLHPILFTLIITLGYLLWRSRAKLGAEKVGSGIIVLTFLLWLLAGDPLINTMATIGSGYLLWHLRQELSMIAVIYGWCGLGLLFASGSTMSLNRLSYGIVSTSLVLGILVSRYSRWGYLTLSFFAITLASLSVRFTQGLWVG
ncbi:mannosyltransferase family protein [Mastigocoleus sp. MO_188.B34]|uniref:mannosyltransferase family protein n=1 Tax=Mastigocoleus sp. MO_188.B34 TaxID=3036635 RepID=UPI002617D760|nr:mannosyltransferase family protein [Mastigocoleus sp. MO_188.B34]MDJ0696644.1 mannosyltransferase family protein [Mastigocoleus sp. MO_188.B34]